MAIDSRISLAPTGNINVGRRFGQALTNLRNIDIINQQRDFAPLQQQTAQLNVDLLSAQQPAQIQAAEFAASPQSQLQRQEQQALEIGTLYAQSIKPLLDSGNIQGTIQQLQQNKVNLQKIGMDTTGVDEDIAQMQTPEGIRQLRDETDQAIQLSSGLKQRPVAVRSSAPITDPTSGQVSIPTFDPNTQTTRLVPVEGALQETPQQKRVAEAKTEVSKAGLKRRAELTESRTSDLKKGFSKDRRAAKASLRKLNEVSKLVSKATQGIPGQAKLLASRFFPGIDARDEGALSAGFKNLALDELQKFTGPTTDFEFAVTEDIAGSLGQGAFANNARIASLQRAAWFANRQAEQFDRWIDAGHNPDRFSFDFDEKITPIKGGETFNLRDIQDTAVANHISVDEVLKRLRAIE